MKQERWSVTFKTNGEWLGDRLFKTEEEARTFMDDREQVEEYLIDHIHIGRKIKLGKVNIEDIECKLDETYIIPIC